LDKKVRDQFKAERMKAAPEPVSEDDPSDLEDEA